MERLQPDATFGGLACKYTNAGSFHSVIDRISHRVRQRILDRFQQTFIQASLLPGEFYSHLAAAGPRKVANHSGKLTEEISHRLHPRLHHRLAKIRRHTVKAPRQLGKVRR